MPSTFIRRPVLAAVVSILIVLLGLLSLQRLPMSLFPDVAPPEVNVTVEYTGANAATVTRAAIMPLERAINGVPGMKYMSSDAGNDGVGVVQVLFETGTDPDVAAVNVQNRVNAVMGELPPEVIRNGVKIGKEVNAMLLYLNIFSSDDELDEKFLYNFADIHILEALKRVKGVGYADILGAKEYAMRVWLRPDKLAAYGVGTDEVLDALAEHNVEAAPGKLGENSERGTGTLQYTLSYTGKLTTPEAYENIPIRAGADGEILRLRDVADVELGVSYFDVQARYNGRPAASIMLKQLPGSNASEVIAAVKELMETLKRDVFLPGMDYEVSFDVSRFLDAAVAQVARTFLEAFLLVALVLFVFLRDGRAVLALMLTVPVSLIGALTAMLVLGFSLNLVTLFALVLAIGIVVDNAIVVIEAVHARMEATGASPKDATLASMREIGSAIFAITLVMGAVFVPMGFISGPAGVFYRQFALTMAVAIGLSGLVALTLTPALAALFLRRHSGPTAGFFQWFDARYAALENAYTEAVRVLAPRPLLTLGGFGGSLALVVFLVGIVPTGFVPTEDQGTFYVSIDTPPGATLERTSAVVDAVREVALTLEGVTSVSTLAGANILSDGTGATYGTLLVNLADWGERKSSVQELINELEARTQHIKDAKLEIFPPPTIPGYGNASGFELRVVDRTGRGDLAEMEAVVEGFLAALLERPEIDGAFSIFNARYPEYVIDVDVDKAARSGVTVEDAMRTLQTLIGGEYATNFIRFGRLYKVMVQAPPEARATPEDLLAIRVKNERGEMVPLSAFVTLRKAYGVDQLTRFDGYPSAEINGTGAPGVSSGTVIEVIRDVARAHLPRGFGIEWSGMTRDEVAAGNEGLWVFLVCLLFVYLILAAQYESFTLPFVVVLSLPPGLAGAFAFLQATSLENNIYTHIALVILIGLLGKNAILIVEMAEQRRREGFTPISAVLQASRQRLRPVLMTSLAFVAGLVPLAFASGAGAVANRNIGVATIGGMVVGTIGGLLLVPGLYLLVRRAPRGDAASPSLALTACLVLLPFLGCATTNVAERELELPSVYEELRADGESAALLDWQTLFGDPRLSSLIAEALRHNPDRVMALQRINMARAAVRLGTGRLLPTLSARADVELRRFGRYTSDGAGNLDTEILPGQRVPEHLPDFLIGLESSWELDIWGRLWNQRQASIARLLATEEADHLIRSNLVAEVASDWFTLIALDETVAVLEGTLKQQEDALELVKALKAGGRTSALAERQFEAEVRETQARLVTTRREILARERALNLLLGRVPAPIERADARSATMPAALPPGAPADLLRMRPDVRLAELELKASGFDVNAARAAFFPRVDLGAMAGLQAFHPVYLLTPQSIVYSLAGGILAPLLNRAELDAEYHVATAAQLESLAAYQKTILEAYVEASNALTDVKASDELMELKRSQLELRRQAAETAELLFVAGKSGWLEVLLAQTEAAEAELDIIEVWREQQLSRIALYRALGGGWTTTEPPTPRLETFPFENVLARDER